MTQRKQQSSGADETRQKKQMQQKESSSPRQGGQSEVQGEGNYTAAKEYDDAQRRFVESGRVDQAAREAAPRSQQEADEMKAAEREGRSHAKDEDPQLRGPGESGAKGGSRP